MAEYKVPFTVQNDAVYVSGQANGQDVEYVVDTGDSIGPVFSSADARRLNLPDDGPVQVSGAGGTVQLTLTHADVELGGAVFQAERGIIDDSLPINLLGLPFFEKIGKSTDFEFSDDRLSGYLIFGDVSAPTASVDDDTKETLGQALQDLINKLMGR